jgi:2,3-bisphosphoglycerate-dependent phosphoglycerate mutase
MQKVILVRHAEPVLPGTAGFDEYTRPLTDKGLSDAQALVSELAHLPIAAVYSSPMLRAVQTVQGLAQARGLEVKTHPELYEHILSPEPIANWREVLGQSWADFDFVFHGGHSLRQSQERVWGVLAELMQVHPNQTIAVGGHGTIFALLLHRLDARVGFDFHLAMPMPAIYVLEAQDNKVQSLQMS